MQNLVLLRTTFVHRLLNNDEGKVPFLMSLPQMKNLGVSLDLRGTPEKILFHTSFLKGQGVPLHRNRAGHLTLDVNEICRKARLSAGKGRHRQLLRRSIVCLQGEKCHQHSYIKDPPGGISLR